MKKGTIENKNGILHYYDKNGVELRDGDTVAFGNGETRILYSSDDGQLGTDATNPAWVASGKAAACEYGIYPLTKANMSQIAKVAAI